jgi:hypothetical protein
VRNIAGMGYFSTDRTVSEYAAKVWAVPASTRAAASTRASNA